MTKPKIIILDNNQKAICAIFIVIDDHKDKDIKKGKSMIDTDLGRGLDNPHIKKVMTLARASVIVGNGLNCSCLPANYDGMPTDSLNLSNFFQRARWVVGSQITFF